MKGILEKTNRGWFVLYTECQPKKIVTEWNKSLPLHPNIQKHWFEDEDVLHGAEIDFEIVNEYIDNNTNQVQKYAKIISPNMFKKFSLYEHKETITSSDTIQVPTEITLEDMKKQSWKYDPRKKMDIEFIRAAFVAGAQWYKEQVENNGRSI